MTLRDYFAAHAMQGMIAHHGMGSREDIAKMAFAQADAMLAAKRST